MTITAGADVMTLQVCHDEQLTKDGHKGLAKYPRLKTLCEAVEARPNVKAFRESGRYLG